MALLGAALGLGCGYTEEKIDDYYNVDSPAECPNSDKAAIAIVFDNSGSMGNNLNGTPKIDQAKRSLDAMIDAVEAENQKEPRFKIGLFYFDDSTVRKAAEIMDLDASFGGFKHSVYLRQRLEDLEADSNTPLGLALAYAERELDKATCGPKYIIMLTDGKNNAGKGPESVYSMIVESNIKNPTTATKLYVVPFNMDPDYFTGLEKLGAKKFPANNLEELNAALFTIQKMILESPINPQ